MKICCYIIDCEERIIIENENDKRLTSMGHYFCEKHQKEK